MIEILSKIVNESQNISWWIKSAKETKRPNTSIVEILEMEYEEVSINKDNTWYQAVLLLKTKQ